MRPLHVTKFIVIIITYCMDVCFSLCIRNIYIACRTFLLHRLSFMLSPLTLKIICLPFAGSYRIRRWLGRPWAIEQRPFWMLVKF